MNAQSQKTQLVLVEDNPGDVDLFRWALESANLNCELTVLRDGGSAMEHFYREATAESPRIPTLVILDLNLPKASGSEVLARMRSTTAFATVPVVIWTSSSAVRDRRQVDALNVCRYLVKPSEITELEKVGTAIREVLDECMQS